MTRIAVAAVLILTARAAEAQTRPRVLTRPEVPSQATLDRLNLKLAWRAYVPVAGARDGIATVQVLEDMVLVQTRSGTIAALDPEDGTTRWRVVVGEPHRSTRPLGVNSRTLFVFSGVRLYALDRKTGALQWEFDSPQAPTAAPAADDLLLFLALGVGRLKVYQLPKEAAAGELPPKPAAAGAAPAAEAKPPTGLPGDRAEEAVPEDNLPRFLWDYEVVGRLDQPPLLYSDSLLIADSTGTFFAFSKYVQGERYRFRAASPLSAPMAQYGRIAYVPSRDYNVYALDIPAGRILWRFTADRSILRQPVVTDDDVYLAPERGGLFRVDRQTGLFVWRNAEADRYLAENGTLVYALDLTGHLLVLDRARGNRLGSLNVRDYVVAVTNGLTDRVYLAAHDGLFVCLRDRDYAKPWRVTNPPAPAPAAAPAGPPKAPPPEKEEKAAPPKEEKAKPAEREK